MNPIAGTSSTNLTRAPLQREALWAASRFSPRGDVSDLDQSCLSTSAGHKGAPAKLFILTSFKQNKPCALGAYVPQRAQLPPSKKNAGPPIDGRQLSLHGHDFSPGSGYQKGLGADEKRLIPGHLCAVGISSTAFQVSLPEMSDRGPHIRAGGSEGGLEHVCLRCIQVLMGRYGLFYQMITQMQMLKGQETKV